MTQRLPVYFAILLTTTIVHKGVYGRDWMLNTNQETICSFLSFGWMKFSKLVSTGTLSIRCMIGSGLNTNLTGSTDGKSAHVWYTYAILAFLVMPRMYTDCHFRASIIFQYFPVEFWLKPVCVQSGLKHWMPYRYIGLTITGCIHSTDGISRKAC